MALQKLHGLYGHMEVISHKAQSSIRRAFKNIQKLIFKMARSNERPAPVAAGLWLHHIA
jgi:hypothetical protein